LEGRNGALFRLGLYEVNMGLAVGHHHIADAAAAGHALAQLHHVGFSLTQGVPGGVSRLSARLDRGAPSLAAEALNTFLLFNRHECVRRILTRYRDVPGVRAYRAFLQLSGHPEVPLDRDAGLTELARLAAVGCPEALSVLWYLFVHRPVLLSAARPQMSSHMIGSMHKFFRAAVDDGMSQTHLPPKFAAAVLFNEENIFPDEQKVRLAHRSLRDDLNAGDGCLYLGARALRSGDVARAAKYFYLGRAASPDCAVRLATIQLSRSTTPFLAARPSPWAILHDTWSPQAVFHLAMDVIVSGGKVPFDGSDMDGTELLKEAGKLGHQGAIEEYRRRKQKPHRQARSVLP
jgi:hypothetical protein